jgi:hypothetical protein
MLNDDYREMLHILLEERVEFILVGAYALAAHGYPRATGDIDIWVHPSSGNAVCVYKALAKFGAPLQDLSPQDFSNPDVIFQIGVAPRRIDIITSITGVDFSEASQKTLQIEIDTLSIQVLSISDLIKNKEATGREKDLLDVKTLRQHYTKM